MCWTTSQERVWSDVVSKTERQKHATLCLVLLKDTEVRARTVNLIKERTNNGRTKRWEWGRRNDTEN